MQLSIGKKLFLGFGGVILAIIVSAAFANYQLNSMRQSQENLLKVQYPVLLAGNRLVANMDKSLAALRGYMILGADPAAAIKFKEQRIQAWQEIDNIIGYFNQLKAALGEENLAKIEEIKQLLPDLKRYQQEIEDIAQRPENQPALELLIKDAGPKARQMLDYLTEIIDIEGENEDEERKELLKILSDSRGSFAISVGSLRAYLITGENTFKDRFDENWLINTDSYIAIDDEIDMLTQEQLELWQKYEGLREQFAPVSIKMFEARLSAQWNVANYKLEKEVEPNMLKVSLLLEQVSKMLLAQEKKEEAKLEKAIDTVSFSTQLASLFAILAGVIIALWISRSIAQSMEALVKDAHDIAEGNLASDHSNEQLRSADDDIGTLARKFFDMSHSLSDMISKVKSHGVQMRIAAFQVASLSEEILSTTEQEQNNSGEVSDATEDLLQVSQKSLSLATESSEIVHSAQEQANIGISAVTQTIGAMEQSVAEVNKTVTRIESLDEASQQIDKITDTIHQIAEQTNLLALNAAIEAARAGEHGRGFAVVADEVRNLASKTSQATVEITDLIHVLKSRVEESIESMSKAANHVYNSQAKAAETANAIDSISQSIDHINVSSMDICTGAESQMVQLRTLQEKLNQLFETLKEDGSRAGAVSIVARVLYSVTENINESLDRFITVPILGGADGDSDRRQLDRVYGCLRVEIYQEDGAFEGVTRSFSGDHLGIEVSTKLTDSAPVVLTIFLPHRSFEDYKSQIPITIEGKIERSDFVDSVYHYSVKIGSDETDNLSMLQRAFDFFAHGIDVKPDKVLDVA